MKVNICLFDDSIQIIESLTTLFSLVDDFNIVASYSNPKNTLEKIKSSNANMVIMDIDMPGLNGIEAIKEVRKSNKTLPVIMFTVFDDEDKIFDAICAGANGYLLKNTEPPKLIEAVLEVMNGGSPMSPGIARKVLNKFQLINANPDQINYELTIREKEILRYLTNGLSYKMIAAECDISFETVRTHIKNIYSKLHVASMTEAVAKAINERIV